MFCCIDLNLGLCQESWKRGQGIFSHSYVSNTRGQYSESMFCSICLAPNNSCTPFKMVLDKVVRISPSRLAALSFSAAYCQSPSMTRSQTATWKGCARDECLTYATRSTLILATIAHVA